MKIYKDTKTGIYYRIHNSDLSLIREAYRVYNIDNLTKKDIVLDLGGHIGSFSYRIQNKVSKIILYEPDEINYKISLINLKKFDNVELVNSAVIENNDKYRFLYKSNSNSDGSHSLCKNNRPIKNKVNCSNYFNIIKKYTPYSNKKRHRRARILFV